MANIAEGFDRNSKMQKIYFMNVAMGSTSETRSHLYIALDMKYINGELFNSINTSLNDISRILGGFVKSIR